VKNAEIIKVFDTHVAGEPLRVVFEGLPELSGNTMLECLQNAKKVWDPYRQKIICEPRGHYDMFGALLTKPSPMHKNCHYGVIFCDSTGYTLMCGHGSLCLAYLLVKLGKVKRTYPTTKVLLDTPAGQVEIYVETPDENTIGNVIFRGIPSFVYKMNQTISTSNDNYPQINYDVAFGGRFFALIDVEQLKLTVNIKNIPIFVSLARELLININRELNVVHPKNPKIQGVKAIQFYQKLKDNKAKNFVTWGEGLFDRSPSGTATSSKMALLAEKKQLKPKEEFIYESIIGSNFKGWVELSSQGKFNFYIPVIKTRPYLTAISEFIFEKDDPFAGGFNIGRI
jgi:proline racemase